MVLVKKYKLSILSVFILFYTSCGGGGSSTENSKRIVLHAVSLPILQTGQEKSYDDEGNLVTDGTEKDDGFYRKGVAPSYTRDATSSTVKDSLTGLIWQDDAATSTEGKPWLNEENYNRCLSENNSDACFDTTGDTASSYCEALVLGGYDDWRLPTVKELDRLLDYGHVSPSQSTVFQNGGYQDYWTSSSINNHSKTAWSIDFNDGKVDADNKNFYNYVRCVRG